MHDVLQESAVEQQLLHAVGQQLLHVCSATFTPSLLATVMAAKGKVHARNGLADV
jgi:hypothetical protein